MCLRHSFENLYKQTFKTHHQPRDRKINITHLINTDVQPPASLLLHDVRSFSTCFVMSLNCVCVRRRALPSVLRFACLTGGKCRADMPSWKSWLPYRTEISLPCLFLHGRKNQHQKPFWTTWNLHNRSLQTHPTWLLKKTFHPQKLSFIEQREIHEQLTLRQGTFSRGLDYQS